MLSKTPIKQINSGFTLIELLIVLVIISISSGIVISIIKPLEQQNRARNAVIRSSLTKYAFAINSMLAFKGDMPSGGEFSLEVQSTVIDEDNCHQVQPICVFKPTYVKTFEACSSPDPETFNVNSFNQCYFKYNVPPGDSQGKFKFRVWTPKITQLPPYVFYVFDSSHGLYECDSLLGIPSVWVGPGALRENELVNDCKLIY